MGQYVDLDKLLTKNHHFYKGNDTRMGLFSCDGLMYFAPANDCEPKITNIRKWEQPFRVYAAIYSKANPHRASEIWQYVHIINSAASTYQWSNVSEYDFTFRQLTHEYPDRSWAKTYLQGWNLIMRDVITQDHQRSTAKTFYKDNICWPFNKGKCTDNSCGKEHRCSYCGKWGHGIFNCRKKKRNNINKKDHGSNEQQHKAVSNTD